LTERIGIVEPAPREREKVVRRLVGKVLHVLDDGVVRGLEPSLGVGSRVVLGAVPGSVAADDLPGQVGAEVVPDRGQAVRPVAVQRRAVVDDAVPVGVEVRAEVPVGVDLRVGPVVRVHPVPGRGVEAVLLGSVGEELGDQSRGALAPGVREVPAFDQGLAADAGERAVGVAEEVPRLVDGPDGAEIHGPGLVVGAARPDHPGPSRCGDVDRVPRAVGRRQRRVEEEDPARVARAEAGDVEERKTDDHVVAREFVERAVSVQVVRAGIVVRVRARRGHLLACLICRGRCDRVGQRHRERDGAEDEKHDRPERPIAGGVPAGIGSTHAHISYFVGYEGDCHPRFGKRTT
jgi:hypothetical protein